MSNKTFYDIHLHVFNLSHPYFRAFISRFNFRFMLVLAPVLAWGVTIMTTTPILRRLVVKKFLNMIYRVKNLLSVMENDAGSCFLLLENCLRENGMLDEEGLHIGEETYSKIVLTPLMMDFRYKGREADSQNKDIKYIHYKEHSRKPIKEQVIDVFNGIRDYINFRNDEKYKESFPYLVAKNGQPTKRIFEIYPFLGINTKSYSKEEISELMEKYFDSYEGNRSALANKMGKFDGNIDNLSSNFAAGIKLYPPLDYDPWPDDPYEKEKVKTLYEYCERKGIPITVHGSVGGFAVLKGKLLKEVTKVSKWETVASVYKKLKLNLAHFPANEKILWVFPKRKRLKQIIKLVLEHKNVYVDFSNRATSDKYYIALRNVINNLSQTERDILLGKILFGTDFSVNLISIDSYNEYFKIFSNSDYIDRDKRENYCSLNPEKFLFMKAEEDDSGDT